MQPHNKLPPAGSSRLNVSRHSVAEPEVASRGTCVKRESPVYSGEDIGTSLAKRSNIVTLPPDIDGIDSNLTAIVQLIGRLERGGVQLPDVQLTNKALLLETLERMSEALLSYKRGKLPQRLPCYNEAMQHFTGQWQAMTDLCGNFETIRVSRSTVQIDERFLDSFAGYLTGDACLEIYAGLGVLSHELRERNIDIEATDDFSFVPQLGMSEQNRVFGKVVKKMKASEAVKAFIEKLPPDRRATIIVAFPQGMRGELRRVFEVLSARKDLRIVGIGVDEKQWKLPQNLERKDLTEQLHFVSKHTGGVFSVIEYRAPDIPKISAVSTS